MDVFFLSPFGVLLGWPEFLEDLLLVILDLEAFGDIPLGDDELLGWPELFLLFTLDLEAFGDVPLGDRVELSFEGCFDVLLDGAFVLIVSPLGVAVIVLVGGVDGKYPLMEKVEFVLPGSIIALILPDESD